jgi:hypothetical protein
MLLNTEQQPVEESISVASTPPSVAHSLRSKLEKVGSATNSLKAQGSLLPTSAGDTSDVSLPLSPLFVPNWNRAIISGALATNSGDGPLNIEFLIELLARRQRVERLPHLPVPTLRRGVQLLLDISQAMLPWERDQRMLQKEVQDVVGTDKVQSLRFVGCPARGVGMGTKSRWKSFYTPPPRGTVVLMLTDLGIGRPPFSTERASVAEWEAFVLNLRKAGCPLVALVPYAPERYPFELTRIMTAIQWDRQTTPATVRREVGPAHEVTR